MDKETREILDRFCADKIDVEEAARALNTSIEDSWSWQMGMSIYLHWMKLGKRTK
jgi:hypothetical protein